MTERFSCHVFAHSEGRYQTVYAVGVATDEKRHLEQFFFGQSADQRYLDSLREQPGVIWRRIGSRISLTRVSLGDRDANDRTTLRFETLLAESTNTALRSQVADLCTGKWNFSDDGVAISVQGPSLSKSVNAGQISKIVLAARDGSRVVARADELSLEDASKIIQHAADIPGFSLCYKSLNRQAPVSVNIVALAVSETVKMKPKRSSASMTRQPNRPSTQRTGHQSNATFTLIVILIAFVVQTGVLWMVVGASSGETDTSKMQKHIIDRIVAKSEEQMAKIEAESGKQMKKTDVATSEFHRLLDEQRSENKQHFAEITNNQKRQDAKFAERITLVDRQLKEMKSADVNREDKAKRKRREMAQQLEELDKRMGERFDALQEISEQYHTSGNTNKKSGGGER